MAHRLHPEIADALERGVCVLTGNQRAARTLRQHADLDWHASGLTTWQTPAILAWDTWTAALWRQLLVTGHAAQLLLNAAQEHTLWRAIIAADPVWQSLLPPDSLAELAADAWARVCAYGGEGRLRAAASSADTRAFARWALAFTARCQADGLLSQAQLEAALAQLPVKFSPDGYLLIGFDRTTPTQQTLLAAIRKRGLEVRTLEPAAPGTVHLLGTDAPRQEFLTAAHAIRQHLERQPDARIALIVPNLAARRSEIDRGLRETLAPECNTITSVAAPPFEFSLGIPLAHTPPVVVALDLLRWAQDPLPIDRIGHLLLSPHVAGGRDLYARAAFDAYKLRRHRPLLPELSLDALLRLTESPGYAAPDFAATLRSVRRTVEAGSLTEFKSYADWTDAFRAVLTAAGWAKGLDSAGFQTIRRWEGALDELATLDFTGIRVSRRDALAALERLTRRTLFAPETRGARVQVMEPLEAAGSTFDALWFLGAGDAIWPRRPGTNPLLSRHLRRDLKMPGTDAANDLADARRTAHRLAASAPLVTFSYARELPDTHQRPSPALAEMALPCAEAAPTPIVPQPVTLEIIDDTTTLPPLPDRVLRGGAEVLKHQAACGFRAFAEHRLYATALHSPGTGMDARDTGSAVHRVLQTFWSRVQTQDNLRALLPDARRALLTEAIEAALAPAANTNRGVWSAAYLDVQCERLLTLLDTWLVQELGRAVPFEVRAEELKLDDVRIGPLRLTLRVDRIDRTEFGDVILDYKTGEANPRQWLTDRPDEPQLPLYAVVSGAPLAGVAFASVRAGRYMDLQGFATESDILPKRSKLQTATLDGHVGVWRDTLTALAEDFHRGDLRVRPKAYPHTCQYCKQRLLCRLDLSLQQAADEEDEASEAVDG